jgi:hypothetical protein
MRFINKPSPLFLQAVEVLKKLELEEGTADRAFAAATADQYKEYFRKQRSLDKPSPGRFNVFTLFGKKQGSLENPRGTDHPEVWLRKGRPVLFTSQPYALGTEDLRQLLHLCSEFCGEVTIHTGSYYFPGATLMVEIEPTEERNRRLHKELRESEQRFCLRAPDGSIKIRFKNLEESDKWAKENKDKEPVHGLGRNRVEVGLGDYDLFFAYSVDPETGAAADELLDHAKDDLMELGLEGAIKSAKPLTNYPVVLSQPTVDNILEARCAKKEGK